MRSPARVLNSLTKHSQTTEYRFERLYRILFNEEMYYLAYQRIYAKPGNMTQGADGKTIDRMSLSRIEKLILSLKDESYSPQPSRRVHIPKKNGKTRPLGVPSFDDKLVQEVVRMVLEAIYEGHFEDTSHGFRPHRSCHTALNAVQKTFTGTIHTTYQKISESGLLGTMAISWNVQRNAARWNYQSDIGQYLFGQTG